jgi:CRP-like cAMP-binding protein
VLIVIEHMSAQTNPGIDPLLRRLDSIATLSDQEREALRRLPMQILDIGPDQDVVREGDRPARCCLLLEGVACIYKVTASGRRQISAFQLPGDIPDLLSMHLESLDSSVRTITRCKVAFMWHADLRALCREFPGIGDAFWRSTLIEASIFKEWITNVGQREAYARLAHLLCETFVRASVIDLCDDYSCPFPVTQDDLAAATGMTNVHVNRTLKELRTAGLIEIGRGKLTITDWGKLRQAGEFDPGYLHLSEPEKVPA